MRPISTDRCSERTPPTCDQQAHMNASVSITCAMSGTSIDLLIQIIKAPRTCDWALWAAETRGKGCCPVNRAFLNAESCVSTCAKVAFIFTHTRAHAYAVCRTASHTQCWCTRARAHTHTHADIDAAVNEDTSWKAA